MNSKGSGSIQCSRNIHSLFSDDAGQNMVLPQATDLLRFAAANDAVLHFLLLSISQLLYLSWRTFRICLTLSLPRVINFKFPLQPHQEYYITQYEELGFRSLLR